MDDVRLKNDQGSFHDPESGLCLSRDDCKPLKEPLGKLTRERLASGALVRCKPKQEACHETEGASDAGAEEAPAGASSGLGDSQGQAVAETDEGAADSEALPEPVEKAAPAPTSKKRASKKKAAK